MEGALDDIVSDSDDDKNNAIDEDELAEIKRAKQRERELIKARNLEKIDTFEMIKPVVKGDKKA